MNAAYKLICVACIAVLALAACGPTATPATVQPTAPAQATSASQATKPPATAAATSAPQATEPATAEATSASPAGRAEVRLSGWVSSPSETALLESLLYRFSIANPDIVVKYEPITGDYLASINTMVASGTEPDIYYMDIFAFPAFAQNEVLLPLDDLMAGTGTEKSAFIPALMDAFTYDGKIYGIPKDFNTLGLFYNKDLFAAAGVDEPTDDWTWDDLKAAATKLTDAGNNVYGFGVPPDAGRFPVFVFQAGGSIMNEDFSDTLIDSAEAVQAAEFYTSFRTDKIGAIPADLGEGWQGTLFGKGQLAMVYEGGWLIPYLKQQFPSVKYGVVTPPAGPGGEGNLIFTVAYSVSKNTKNPEAAWKVIEFLTNEESQTTVLESGFALPTRTSLQESEYLKNNPDSAAIFRGALEGAHPFMWGPVGSDVNEQMGKALERVYLENQGIEESLKQAAEAIRAKIAESK